MGQAIMRVQFDFVRHALGLPDHVRIVAIAQAFDGLCDDRLCLKLESESLAEIVLECKLPEVRGVFQGFEPVESQSPENGTDRRHGQYYSCDVEQTSDKPT